MPSSRNADSIHNIHGTCIARGETGILLTGPSGAGKSDLALRLLAEGWKLVADDRIDLCVERALLLARAPESLSGLIEVRGIGLISLEAAQVQKEVRVNATISLVNDRKDVSRMPDPAVTRMSGFEIPAFSLCAFDASALAKVALIADLAQHPDRLMK